MRHAAWLATAVLMGIAVYLGTVQAQSLPTDLSTQPRSNFLRALSTSAPTPSAASQATITASGTPFPLQTFPHVALYGSANSSGWPFVGSTAKVGTCANNPTKACSVNTDCGDASLTCNNPAQRPPDGAPLNPDVIAAYSKFPLSIIPITPLADG